MEVMFPISAKEAEYSMVKTWIANIREEKQWDL